MQNRERILSVLAGIIDNDHVVTPGNIEDHTDYKDGYGLGLNGYERYRRYSPVRIFPYANQFEITNTVHMITITLDMTQENGKHGILSYEFHMKAKDDMGGFFFRVDPFHRFRHSIPSFRTTRSKELDQP